MDLALQLQSDPSDSIASSTLPASLKTYDE